MCSSKDEKSIINTIVETTNKVLLESSSAVEFIKDQKVYLLEDRILDDLETQYLLTDNEDLIDIPFLSSDEEGVFISCSSSELAKKLFKCVCNVCSFEWEGGVFTIWCPSCGSSDFRVVRNR
ncbi:MAG: hypothetical protein PVI40_09185 [Chlamydiota bacterium]